MSWAELQWQPLRKKIYGSVGWSQEASENWVTGALTDRKLPLRPGSDLTLFCAALPLGPDMNTHNPLDLLQRRSYTLTQNLKTNFKGGLLCLLCCSMSSFAWLPVKNDVIYLCSSSPVWNEIFELFFFLALFSFLFFFWLVAPQKFVQLVGGASHTSRKKTFISCALTSLFLSFIYIYGLLTTPGCELWDWLFK